MADPWESDPIVTPAAPADAPWTNDPVIQPAAVPQTTWTGVAKNVAAAAAEDIPASIINFASDPGGTLLHLPIVAAGTAYDAAAPYLGLPRMSDDLRNMLYNEQQPGQTNTPGVEGQGTQLMNWVDRKVLRPDRSATTLPASPVESVVRRSTAAAGTVAALGPGGILAPLAAAGSAAAAPSITAQVPDWLKPGVDLAVNAVPQVVTGALASRPGPSVDAADAATMQLARDKYDIPLNATDITPGSGFRTPASVHSSIDGLQRNIVSQMGEDPNTSDLLSRDRITSGPDGVMDRTATRVGHAFDDVASRTSINPAETNNVITKLANIDGGLDLENLTDAQKAVIRRNIDLVQNAAANGNNSISGADYQGLTRTNTPIDRLAGNSDPNVAAIGLQIKSAIDDGFQASASPADKAALTQARYQWRLMKTVQPLVEKAQGASIDPGAFASRVVAASRKLDGSTGGIAYTGGGTIGELGRIADVIDRGPTPTSPSLVGDIMHPPGGPLGYLLEPKMEGVAHTMQVVGNQLAGPYLRSGIHAQSVINNALYRPTLLGGALQGGVGGVAANPLMLPPP